MSGSTELAQPPSALRSENVKVRGLRLTQEQGPAGKRMKRKSPKRKEALAGWLSWLARRPDSHKRGTGRRPQ